MSSFEGEGPRVFVELVARVALDVDRHELPHTVTSPPHCFYLTIVFRLTAPVNERFFTYLFVVQSSERGIHYVNRQLVSGAYGHAFRTVVHADTLLRPAHSGSVLRGKADAHPAYRRGGWAGDRRAGNRTASPFLSRAQDPHVQSCTAIAALHLFIFLSIVVLGIGEEISIGNLKRIGKQILIICFIQAFFTWALVSTTFLLLGFRPIIALIIGSIGIATAPASTFVIMDRLGITGLIRSVIGGIVIFDDIIEVVVFSVAVQVALAFHATARVSWTEVLFPVVKEFGFAIVLGFGIFVLLYLVLRRRWLQPEKAKSGPVLGPEFLSRLISEIPGPSMETFIIIWGCVCLGVSLAFHWHLPFLITAVTAGILISNLYNREIFELPQAGVAAIEAFFVSSVLGSEGEVILGIILHGPVFFEVVGVLTSERALMRWRSWVTGGGDLIVEEELLREKLRNEKENISRLFRTECFRVPLDVASKGEAIWELICTLHSTGFIQNPGEILEIILQRERQGGTTIGEGIAILHGRIPELSEPAVALGVLPKDRGIEFDGADDTR